jgi:hypothetical protein
MTIQTELAATQQRMAERVTFMSSEKMPLESKLWMMAAQKRDYQRTKMMQKVIKTFGLMQN